MRRQINVYSQQGQIVLVTLLVAAVALTLGLSVSKKVVTETKIEVDEENLRKAFDAAESGINYYMGTGETEYSTDNGSVATVSARSIAKTGNYLEFTDSTLPGSRVNFWLVGHDDEGNLDYSDIFTANGTNTIYVCVDDSNQGLLQVEYFYANSTLTAFYSSRWAYNLDGGTVPGYRNALDTDCGNGKKSVMNFSPASGTSPIMISVRPLNSTIKAALSTTAYVPEQGKEISSTAVVGDQSTGVRRTLKVSNIYEMPAFMLDAVSADRVVTQ